MQFDMPQAIKTWVDPSYIIKYEGSKFVPPNGKVLLIVGQDQRHIQQYMVAAKKRPAGFTFYWSPTEADGINSDSVRGYEIQNGKWITDTYKNIVVQSGMWMAGVNGGQYCSGVTNGDYDSTLDLFCQWAKKAACPIYLRIGYEFDGPHNKLDPGVYKALYRYIADRVRIVNKVKNIALVWHSYAAPPYKNYELKDWYPGDEYVDWFGVTIFNQLLGGKNLWLDAVVDMARKHKKPVMVAEAGPLGGIVGKGYVTWNDWFVKFFTYIYEKNIKAISYISCDWNKIPQFAHLKWNDTRIQQFPLLLKQWELETGKGRYLKSSDALFGQLGFKGR